MVKHTSFVCFYSVFFFASTFVLIQSKIGDSKNLIHKTNAISWMCEWGVCFKQNITDLCLVPNIVLSVMMDCIHSVRVQKWKLSCYFAKDKCMMNGGKFRSNGAHKGRLCAGEQFF